MILGMDIHSIWTGSFFQFLGKKCYFQKLKNNSFQHNFETVNGEKLTDTILKAEISTENNFWGCGTKSLFGKFGLNTQMCIT